MWVRLLQGVFVSTKICAHTLRLYWCIGGTETVTTVDLFIWFKSIRLIYERNECADFKYDIRSGVGISEVRFLYSSFEGV